MFIHHLKKPDKTKSILIEMWQINFRGWLYKLFWYKKGESSLEVSHKILPYLVELAEQIYNFNIE